MKRRLLCLMPALVMALLTGCALAQPVRESAGADRWVGYYMVYVPQDVMDAGSASDLRPQGIVWGEWDETTETITFPDMAGSALLMFGREDERITVPSVTEMSPGAGGIPGILLGAGRQRLRLRHRLVGAASGRPGGLGPGGGRRRLAPLPGVPHPGGQVLSGRRHPLLFLPFRRKRIPSVRLHLPG